MSTDRSASVLSIEILSCIFEYTDTSSLLSICLVCHEFNEIAGPILYRSLLWDFNDSLSGEFLYQSHFTVFKRRPQWRQFVRKIKFDYAWYMPPYNMDRYIADRAAKEGSLFPSVHTLYLERCPNPLDPPWSGYYRRLFGSFVRLKEFHSYWHWGTLSEILPPSGLVEITLVGSHSTPSMNRWLQMHRETLEAFTLSVVSQQAWVSASTPDSEKASNPEVDFLGGFTALKRLSIPNIPNWPTFVTTLGAIRQLQDLSFTMEQAVTLQTILLWRQL
ncbi:hypothetical protein CPB86DRAFT_793074 [Serendipita vermifera]|nr:hypothetical protein CPB86DRAFT_793074 [Serendipita vermifera]